MVFHSHPENAGRKVDNKSWQTEPQQMILGQTTMPYYLSLKPGSKLIGVRFYPHTINLFLPLESWQATNNPIDATYFNGLKDITSTLDFNDPGQSILRLEQRMAGLLNTKQAQSTSQEYLDFSINFLTTYEGNGRIDELIHALGISSSYLNRIFSKSVGLNPKLFNSILRFNTFHEIVRKNSEFNLTANSTLAGFFDQAHLIHTFQRFANMTPSEYFRHRTSINDYFLR